MRNVVPLCQELFVEFNGATIQRQMIGKIGRRSFIDCVEQEKYWLDWGLRFLTHKKGNLQFEYGELLVENLS